MPYPGVNFQVDNGQMLLRKIRGESGDQLGRLVDELPQQIKRVVLDEIQKVPPPGN